MFEYYTLKNFKAFKSLDEFRIMPITILCGTNSSGKSSFLQSLLLLKQSVETDNKGTALVLNGEQVRLGTWNSIYHNRNPKAMLEHTEIDEPFLQKLSVFSSEEIDSISFGFQTERSYSGFDGEYQEDEQLILNYKDDNKRCTIHSFRYCKQLYDVCLNANGDFESYEQIGTYQHIDIEHIDADVYSLAINSYKYNNWLSFFEGSLNVRLQKGNNLIPLVNIFHQPTQISPMEIVHIKRDINQTLRELNDWLTKYLSSFHYIGPFREPPKRRYEALDTNMDIGNRGENAPLILAHELDKQITGLLSFEPISESFHYVGRSTLMDEVAKWLAVMGIRGLEIIELEEMISLVVDSSSSPEKKVNIADIGFGFSQIFPIIVEGLRMPFGHTLMLEQPEIHLHPKLQMQLADFLVCLALSGRKVIVETHSEHIINRIVRRIVDDETGKLHDLTGIHFIEPTDEGAKTIEIEVNDVFGIKNWPEGFFDQAVGEKEAILFASLRKRQRDSKEEQ